MHMFTELFIIVPLPLTKLLASAADGLQALHALPK